MDKLTPFDIEVETRAKVIYAGWEGSKSFPWIDTGNSFKQDEARDIAERDLIGEGFDPDTPEGRHMFFAGENELYADLRELEELLEITSYFPETITGCAKLRIQRLTHELAAAHDLIAKMKRGPYDF